MRTQRHFPLTLCVQDHDKLAGLLKQHFAITLETEDVSFRGWNWGVTDFRGTSFTFVMSNSSANVSNQATNLPSSTAIKLPLSYLCNMLPTQISLGAPRCLSSLWRPLIPPGKNLPRTNPTKWSRYVSLFLAKARECEAQMPVRTSRTPRIMKTR